MEAGKRARRWGAKAGGAVVAEDRMDVAAPAAAANSPPTALAGGRGLDGTGAAAESLPAGPPLTAQQLESFASDGFVVLRPQVPQGTHAAVIRAADAAYAAAGFDGQQSSSPIGNNILNEVPELNVVFRSPEVDGALRSLLGDNYINHPHRRPHQNDPGSRAQTLHKDSHAGFEVHRAHTPWLVMAMYYPQKVAMDMAPTSLCPGTQFYSREDRFDARHLDGNAGRTALREWGSREVPLVCEEGTVALLHNDLWHRGTANTSRTRRWMFCFMFMRAQPPPPAMPAPAPPEPGGPGGPTPTTARICEHVRGWLQGRAAPPREVDVEREAATLRSAPDDQSRLLAAYALASASDAEAASSALADILTEAASEALLRAAKFGAAAACHAQLLRGSTAMADRLLDLLASCAHPGAAACAARALHEHGAWGAAAPELRARAVEVLHAALRAVPPRPQGRAAKEPQTPQAVPRGDNQSRGTVKNWVAHGDFGFIRPSGGGQDIWVCSAAFGGGTLKAGMDVWYTVECDGKSGKARAVDVTGPAVCRAGGRRVGYRNVRAACLEALAMVPQGLDDPVAERVAAMFAEEIGSLGASCAALVGNPSRQEDGEALVAAALGTIRLLSQPGCGASACTRTWWADGGLRGSLLELARRASETRAPTGARKPGAGGSPGADNGVRYALAYALEALRRSGDLPALREAASAFPDARAGLAAGRPAEEVLLLRRCHLTTKEHTF